jgi:hypothetical protein
MFYVDLFIFPETALLESLFTRASVMKTSLRLYLSRKQEHKICEYRFMYSTLTLQHRYTWCASSSWPRKNCTHHDNIPGQAPGDDVSPEEGHLGQAVLVSGCIHSRQVLSIYVQSRVLNSL